ncbi:MAG: MurR/RpiR family transcriptional regulator [Candidatus Aminicenantes bacterium]|nr:MurR/RpiR family transcriptional regulator [Candidatus Aminicenantes bacterium]MDH5385725.1 MurR/RpiR family transcriptional regulator [Candidatus Aminicenantes bacterium]
MQNKKTDIKLKKTIIEKYQELSKKEKKVADYIIQNHRTIFALSGKELSKKTKVSEATIVRFAQHLGYKGFQHLKSRLIREAKKKIIPEDRFKLMTRGKNHISTVMRVAKQEVENINQTIDQFDPVQFGKFIRIVQSSKNIYTIGLGISSLMARIAAYLFNQAGIAAYACSKDEHSFLERLINLNKNDAVLALSFPPYSRETVDALKFCYQRNVRCLSITNTQTAPTIRWAHAYLIAKSDNLFFTNSISAMSMMLNALSTELALYNKDKTADNSKLILKMSSDEYYP